MPQKNCPLDDAIPVAGGMSAVPSGHGNLKLRELELRNIRHHRKRTANPVLEGGLFAETSVLRPAPALEMLTADVKRLTEAEFVSITLEKMPFCDGHHEQSGDPEACVLGQIVQNGLGYSSGDKLIHCLTDNHSLYRIRLETQAGLQMGFLNIVFSRRVADDSGRRTSLRIISHLLEHVLQIQLEKRALEKNYTASQLRERKLERQVEVDPLTQVENPTAFERKVKERLSHSAASNTRFALIMLDIDHFKSINDLYGHSFGDKYLRVISSAITSAFPPPALIGRLGGDEFGILVETGRTSDVYLDMLFSRCRAAVQRGAAMLGKGDLGRVSIGASLFPEQATTYHDLFELADSALYASKQAGRAVNTIFSASHHDRFNSRAIGRRFDKAIANDLLAPYFQPIVSTTTGATLGYEVLARWCDPKRGILLPDAFASVFKDHRMAEMLTRTMIERALAAYVAAGLDRSVSPQIKLSINLTTFDLLNPEFVFDMQMMLNKHGLDWKMIVIEVTEKVMLDERSGGILRSLQEMRTRGAKVALDDFGTGYGGLRHLAGWPVDILKIDRSFCAKITETASDRAVAEGILLIAQRCGYEVVAEGVETLAQLNALRALGCPQAQGFLFARPMSGTDLARAPSCYILPPATVN